MNSEPASTVDSGAGGPVPDKLVSINIRPLYILPADPLADEVLIPCFRVSEKVDCMVGFFSSEALASLAPGLAAYLNDSRNSLKLIISPLVSDEDRAAMLEGSKTTSAIAQETLEQLFITEDLIHRHTLRCLSWLLREGRVEIKIALMKDALFHPKVWLFQSDEH